MLKGLKKFIEVATELGLTNRTLSLPAPSLALLSAPDADELTDDLIFQKLITEPEILAVSHDLFISQFYNNSVQEAFTALDNFILDRTNLSSPSGTKLMRKVFQGENPMLVFNPRNSQSEKDEQEGYGHIFAGSMIGIRNPTIHEHQWINDRETALECLVFCQHLLRKAKKASKP